MTEFFLERKKNGQIQELISNMWLILCYTVQLVIPKVCTKFQNPKSSSFREIFDRKKLTNTQTYKQKKQLDLMFMKHYAPNRCLYINVAKLRTGVGSAETSYLQNCSVKLFKEHFKVQICKGRLLEKNITFLKFSPINLLIILYQLTKFEAPSCYSFREIMITNFQSPNLRREIIRKK